MTQYTQKMTSPEVWVDRYGDALFRFAWKRLQRTDMAEDVVQETFLEALRVIDTYQGASSEKTWLIGILKHKIVDQIRKASRESPTNDGNPVDDSSDHFFDEKGNWTVKPLAWGNDPGEALIQKHFFRTLTECLRELPQRMAHAFSLREIEQLESEEISRTMGISQSNLGVVLHRARLRLRGCLEVNWLSPASET